MDCIYFMFQGNISNILQIRYHSLNVVVLHLEKHRKQYLYWWLVWWGVDMEFMEFFMYIYRHTHKFKILILEQQETQKYWTSIWYMPNTVVYANKSDSFRPVMNENHLVFFSIQNCMRLILYLKHFLFEFWRQLIIITKYKIV